jgi:[1-hydroxy-2-(trimethylamino)ethyl]phosphonate dioxygenase
VKEKISMATSHKIDEIFAAFRQSGHRSYGERVTQLEHGLQAAYFAEQQGAKPTLIAAALLHDIGHLLHDLGEDVAEHGIDAIHEQLGGEYLEKHFIPAVAEPARLHVAAKRYLCAVDPAYFVTLSPASVQSLALQGGPMTPAEIGAFEALPHFADAVQLRRFDDLGKEPDMPTPDLEHFRPYLEAGLRQ